MTKAEYAIVLVDEIELNRRLGSAHCRAIVDASLLYLLA